MTKIKFNIEMKVLKFGGSCLKDAKSIKKIKSILELYGDDVIIVVSAFGKLTNLLESVFNSKNKDFNIVLDFFKNIMKDLSLSEKLLFKNNFQYESKSEILSIGELVSSKILSHYFNSIGFEHFFLDATKFIKTLDAGTEANLNWEETKTTFLNQKLENFPILTQGFISGFGKNDSFSVTCLGREGSDYSAAIFGHIFNVDEVVLFKDVDGVYDSNPKMNQKAKLLSHINYDEAIKFFNKGNTVVHPKTIMPLKKKNIPLRIKSFYNMKNAGTLIN